MDRDKIQKIGNSVIQHGKMNDRIYLMSLDESDIPGILSDLDNLVEKKGYTKVFAKIPSIFKKFFIDNGYKEEAVIPELFNGKQDGVFLGKFYSDSRAKNGKEEELKDILKKIKSSVSKEKNKKTIFNIRKAGPADILEMSHIYSEVFKSYPFPIQDPQYLLETMKSHVCYYVACEGRDIVAVSSAETNPDFENAEMTDFATLPQYRRKGIARNLLYFMDQDMAEKRIKTVFTIARAVSYGMNSVFANRAYHFAGTLVNNTNIAGSIESMNVWYKKIES
jgi:putative beta-lysine N-acetyltransferase